MRLVKRLHRWASLACAAFWLVQILTGVLIVFHWEIDDALLGSYHRATDPAALEARIDALAPAGGAWHPSSLWTSAGAPDRWDLTLEGPAGAERAIRLAGDGTMLRARAGDAMDMVDYLVGLHQQLLAGDPGEWIVGVSGGLLATNLLLGLWLAWPRGKASRGVRWRQALRPARRGPKAARVWSWHRALGLIVVVPALLVAVTGTLRRFDDGLSALLGVAAPSLPSVAGAPRIGLAQAIRAGESALPGSRLSAVTWPTSDKLGAGDATWQIRLVAPGEWRRAYGMSTVLIDARDGALRGSFPAGAKPLAATVIDDAWAIHTGEVLGLPGRLLLEGVGGALLAMLWFGLRLWWLRRPRARG